MRRSVSLAALLPAAALLFAPACGKGDKAPEASQAPAAAAAPSQSLQGKVVETLDAPPYTYIRLATAQGETWAAVPQAALTAGAEVTVSEPMAMKDFESKTLERKFDLVWFGTLEGGAAAAPTPAAPQGMAQVAAPAGEAGAPMQHPQVATAPAAENVKVEKAQGENARTVSEVHAQRQALAGKPVVVRGTVVKFNGGIMGRNWLHIQDGSGDAGKSDHDLTVTTQDAANPGDVVTVTGTVAVDRDFGAGYSYAVIVEEAKLAK